MSVLMLIFRNDLTEDQENLGTGNPVAEETATTHGNLLWFQEPNFSPGHSFSLTYTNTQFFCLLCILVVLTLWTGIGNIIVCISLVRYKSLRTISNYFIGNLALSDFLLSVTVLPFSMLNDLLGYWMFGKILCNLWLTLDVLSCTASIWMLCVIAFDRFTAVQFPIWYRDQKSGVRAFLYILFDWTFSISIIVPPTTGFLDLNNNYNFDNQTASFQCILFTEAWYVAYSAMGSFIIPLILLIGLYSQIFLVLHARSKTMLQQRKPELDQGVSGSYTSTCTCTQSLIEQKHSPPRQRISLPAMQSNTRTNNSACTLKNSLFSQGHDQGKATFSKTPDNYRTKAEKKAIFLVKTRGSSVSRAIPRDVNGMILETQMEESQSYQTRSGNASGIECVPQFDSNCSAPELFEIKTEAPAMNLKSPQERSSILRKNTTCTCSRELGRKRKSGCLEKRLSFQLAEKAEKLDDIAAHTNSNTRNQRGKQLIAIFSSPINHRSYLRRKISASRTSFMKKEVQATRKMFLIILVFVLCWMPFTCMYISQSFYQNSAVWDPNLVKMIIWLGYSSSSINPILYAILNPEFRRAFLSLTHLHCFIRKFASLT